MKNKTYEIVVREDKYTTFYINAPSQRAAEEIIANGDFDESDIVDETTDNPEIVESNLIVSYNGN